MARYLLLHGGGHRGWHWHPVQPALERLGHVTIAPDLPMDDQSAGASVWADVAIRALGETAGDDVIVVGHSLAGLVLPVVASRMRVGRIVFLSANVPVPGLPWSAYLEEHPKAVVLPWDRIDTDDDGRIVVGWETARELYYPDVDVALAREAYDRLTPVAPIAFSEPCPVDRWPDVASSYVLCKEDQVVGPEWGREVSVERFGAPAIELPGGHSPFLARPDELASVLDQLATPVTTSGSAARP